MTRRTHQDIVGAFADAWINHHGSEQDGRPSVSSTKFLMQMDSLCKADKAAYEFLAVATDADLDEALAEIKRLYAAFERAEKMLARMSTT